MRALVRRHCDTTALRHCVCVEVPEEASTVLSAGRARARIATPADPVACEHPIAQAHGRNRGRKRYRGALVQRLEVLIAVMLARERRASTDALVDSCTELAAALATLPSGLLEIVADAVAGQDSDVTHSNWSLQVAEHPSVLPPAARTQRHD